MSSTAESLFMTAAELAQEADCTDERVEELARAGIIPGIKWGRSWRFVRADAPAFLAETAREDAKHRRERARRSREHFVARRAAKDALRRAAKLYRTPSWADMDAIKAVYAEARRITRETGISHHVDHIIPLQGRHVSGLHVHDNLQILTGAENCRKRNHFEV